MTHGCLPESGIDRVIRGDKAVGMGEEFFFGMGTRIRWPGCLAPGVALAQPDTQQSYSIPKP